MEMKELLLLSPVRSGTEVSVLAESDWVLTISLQSGQTKGHL